MAPAHLVDDLERALDAEPGRPASGGAAIRRGDAPPELLVKPTTGGLIRDALVDWAWIALFWVGMALTPRWAETWAYPLLALLVAGRLHSLGVVLHDATHMPLRGKTWRTRLVELLAGYPIATTLNAMRYHHIRHHRDSGMPSDPYFKRGMETPSRWRPLIWLVQWLRGLLLIPFWTVRAPFGLLALAVPALRNAYGRAFLQDRSGQDLRRSAEVIACARAEAGQLVFQLGVVGLGMLWPEAVLLGYVVPAFGTGLLASYRVLAEHDYQRADDRRVETILATTHDHNLGLGDRILFGPRNIGYHVVHHIHPQVSWRALPALRAWYRAQHPEVYPPLRSFWGSRP